MGSPGVGKTHLASSIALGAARQRKATYFVTCQELIAGLERADLQGKAQQVLGQYARYGLLVIDEVGFLPLGRVGAKMFFQLISMRYEKHSAVVTTNAILDRLLHHLKVFKIVGRSYGTKDIVGLGAEPIGVEGRGNEEASKAENRD